VLKFLTPQALAAAIIGKAGASISELRTTCSAKISITDYGEFYPSTECRVLTASAAAFDSIEKLVVALVDKVAEVAAANTDPALRDAVGTEGDLRFKIIMPRAAVGGLIGKEGANIKKLRDESGAKILVGDSGYGQPSLEQIVTVSGSKEALVAVMKDANMHVQNLNSEGWFSNWGSTTGTSAALPVSTLGFSGSTSPGMDMMMRVAQSMPPYVMEDSRGFALNCIVPDHIVGGLIGKGGAGTKEVQAMTKAKINIREVPGDKMNRSLTIEGPLPNVCAAYMLMMKRYLDAEPPTDTKGDQGAQKPSRPPKGGK